MKTLIIPAAISIALQVVALGQVRTWTESESKREIVAEITDKKLDSSEAELRLQNGKRVWIKAERLIEADQEHIKKWIKPVDHLKVRVVGSGKGTKKVEVTAVAGSRNLRIVAQRSPNDQRPITRTLKPGEEATFTYDAGNNYVVKAWDGKELVDEESWNKKTGL